MKFMILGNSDVGHLQITEDEMHFQNACESHKETYEMLMKEKEEYLEQQRLRKLYEIRVRMAQRTIVKFVEQYYPSWKKRRMKMKAAKKKNKYKFNLSRVNLK